MVDNSGHATYQCRTKGTCGGVDYWVLFPLLLCQGEKVKLAIAWNESLSHSILSWITQGIHSHYRGWYSMGTSIRMILCTSIVPALQGSPSNLMTVASQCPYLVPTNRGLSAASGLMWLVTVAPLTPELLTPSPPLCPILGTSSWTFICGSSA